MIDSGYKAAEVYRFCMASKWVSMKGDEAEAFDYRDPYLKRTVRTLFRKAGVRP